MPRIRPARRRLPPPPPRSGTRDPPPSPRDVPDKLHFLYPVPSQDERIGIRVQSVAVGRHDAEVVTPPEQPCSLPDSLGCDRITNHPLMPLRPHSAQRLDPELRTRLSAGHVPDLLTLLSQLLEDAKDIRLALLLLDTQQVML